MSDEENPFEGLDGDDDFNPFDEKMFQPKKKPQPPVKEAATLDVSQQKQSPDWAKTPEKEKKESRPRSKSKSDEKPKPKASETEVPDWANKEEEPQKKPVPAKKEAQPLVAVSGQNYGTGNYGSQQEEPLLSSTVDISDGNTIDPHRTANWPPFPKKCCWPFRPCFHHNFKAELPQWGYPVVKLLFVTWYVNTLALFWNFVSSLAALDCSGCNSSSLMQTVGLALLFMLCCIPCSYYCWFNTLHNAVRLDSSLKFGIFFFMFVVQIIVSIVFAVGFPGTGAAGLWGAIEQLGHGNSEIAFIMFASSGLWIILVMIQIVAIQRVLMVFRSSGHSLERAQGEAARSGGKLAYQAAQTDSGKTVIKGAAAGAWGKA